MHQMQLFPKIRAKVVEYLGGYLVCDELRDMDTYIVPPALPDTQGILGAYVLAKQAREQYDKVGKPRKEETHGYL